MSEPDPDLDPADRPARPRLPGGGALLVTLVLDFLLLAGGYNVLVPVFEQPDEHTHYFFAQHVARTGQLPVQTDDADTRGPWEQEGSQPPLYYLLAAPLVRLAGGDLEAEDLWYNDQNSMGTPTVRGNENRFIHPPLREGWPWQGYTLAVRLGRALSMLLGVLTVVCVYRIAARVLTPYPVSRSNPLAFAATALVAFNPQFLAVSSTFGNDSLIIALSSLALVLLLRMWDTLDSDDGAGLDGLARSVPALAVVVGLAPLAKISGLTLLAFSLGTLAFLAWRHRSPRLLAVGAATLVAGVAILSGWWYLRNVQLYGDLLGFSHMHPGGTLRDDFRWLDWLREDAFGELKGVWLSSWGLFGWFTILLPGWIYGLLTALAAAAIAGLARALRRNPFWLDRPRLLWLGVWAALVFGSLLRWLSITKGGQGRLLFPAIAAGAVLLSAGLWSCVEGWVGRRTASKSSTLGLDELAAAFPSLTFEVPDGTVRKLTNFGLAAYIGMFALSLYSLFGPIRQAYAGPPTIDEADIPQTAIPAGATFGEGLTLVAVEVPKRVTAGEEVDVTLYWRVDGKITKDAFVKVEIQGQMEEAWDLVMGFGSDAGLTYLGGGTSPPTLLPRDGSILVDRHVFRAPTDAPCGGYLRVSLYDPAADKQWPIRDTDDPDDETPQWATRITVDSAKETGTLARPDRPLLATFDNGIAVYRDGKPSTTSGYSVDESGKLSISEAVAGTMLGWGHRSDVVWTTQEAPGEALQLFVHLLDADDQSLATFDRPLETRCHYPSEVWRAGEVLPDWIGWDVYGKQDDKIVLVHRSGARFTLAVGLYRLSDGSRIPAYGPDGARLKDDMVIMHEIEVTD